MRLLWLPHNSVCLCLWRVTSIVRILRISSSLQMQFNWEHFGGQTLWQAGTSPTHSFFFFQRFAELMSRISRNPVDFKATRICGWLGWVFRARRLVVDRQVRHFRAPTRFKCLRFGFTIFLSAFYFVVVIFLLFFLFFLHNFRLALKVSVHVAERPQLTSAFLHYLYEARYSM